ncbi:MAG: ABC transporter permease [Oscillospiraceae bacterium]|jgi:ribose transport system permease protein|nr:ABC transporter permease [Oscillospiraceae bacterium]
MKKLLKRLTASRNFYLFLFTILIIVIFQLVQPLYLSTDNIRNILYSVSVTGVLMVGIANLLISGNMDLSAGAVGCFCTILGCKLINLGVPWVPATLLTVCMGIVCGLINAFMTYKLGIIPFIGTLGIASVWSGLGAVITKQASVTLTNEAFFKFGSNKFGIVPWAFLYVVLLCVVYGLIMKYTKFGRKVYMSGGNRIAARLAGIKIERIGTIMMCNCSALAALAGMIMASRMHLIHYQNLQDTSTMGAITAALLGGVAFGGGAGGMLGAFLGLMLLNCFKNGIDIIGCNEYVQILFNGVLLAAAMAVDFFNNLSRQKALKAKNEGKQTSNP